MMAHLTETPPRVETLRSDVPAELAAIVHRMIAKKPEERFATPGEVVAALEAFAASSDLRLLAGTDEGHSPQADQGQTRTLPSVSRGTGNTGRRMSFPRRYLPWIAAAVAAAFLGGGLWAGMIIVRFKDKQGRVVAEMAVPEDTTVEISEPDKPASTPASPERPSRDAPQAAGPPSVGDADFQSLFDGKTLAGWDGDSAVWRVEDGTIVGETTGKLPENTFLIWRGGEVDDFELRFEYKLSSTQGNSGIQYRSVEKTTDVGRQVVAGYQFDIDGQDSYTGDLFEERGRMFCARRGEEVILQSGQKRRVVVQTGDPALLQRQIKKNDWNSCRIVAQGFTLLQEINGHMMAKAVDEDANCRRASGLIAIQVHLDGPVKIAFRNLRLRRLGAQRAADTPSNADGKPPIAETSPNPAPPLGDWKPGPEPDVLSGIIPRPAVIPGIHRWQIETKDRRGGATRDMIWSPDGRQLALSMGDRPWQGIRIVDAQSFQTTRIVLDHPETSDFIWGPDGAWLASVGGEKSVRFWKPDGTLLRRVSLPDATDRMFAAPDGRTFALAFVGARQLCRADGKLGPRFNGATSCAWCPDSSRIAVGYEDGTVRIGKANEMPGLSLDAHLARGIEGTIDWAPDGKILATAGSDGKIRLWKADGTSGTVINAHAGGVDRVAWRPDGGWLASCGADNRIRLWKPDGTPGATFEASRPVRSWAWSPNGQYLAGGAGSGARRSGKSSRPPRNSPIPARASSRALHGARIVNAWPW